MSRVRLHGASGNIFDDGGYGLRRILGFHVLLKGIVSAKFGATRPSCSENNRRRKAGPARLICGNPIFGVALFAAAVPPGAA
jgi:hypothetical protein